MNDKEEKDEALEEGSKERKTWLVVWGINTAGLATIFAGLITSCSNAIVAGLLIAVLTSMMFPCSLKS